MLMRQADPAAPLPFEYILDRGAFVGRSGQNVRRDVVLAPPSVRYVLGMAAMRPRRSIGFLRRRSLSVRRVPRLVLASRVAKKFARSVAANPFRRRLVQAGASEKLEAGGSR